jgi:hypothetical protein
MRFKLKRDMPLERLMSNFLPFAALHAGCVRYWWEGGTLSGKDTPQEVLLA